jgi:hypothetical protein
VLLLSFAVYWVPTSATTWSPTRPWRSVSRGENSEENTYQESIRQECNCKPSEKGVCTTPVPHLWILLQCVCNHTSSKVRRFSPRSPFFCRAWVVDLALETPVERIYTTVSAFFIKSPWKYSILCGTSKYFAWFSKNVVFTVPVTTCTMWALFVSQILRWAYRNDLDAKGGKLKPKSIPKHM